MATTKKKTKARAKATRKPATRKSAARSKPARAKKSPKGLHIASLAPSLTVNDIDKSLAWYIDVLGFTMGRRWDRDNKLVGGELKAGPTTVYLSQEDGARGLDRVKGEGFRIYWYTDQNIDKLAAGIKARGGVLASEPKDEWGSRSFMLVDPTGYKITVSSGE